MKKIKIVITDYTVRLILENKIPQIDFINNLDLYSPNEMESLLWHRLKHCSEEKIARLKIDFQNLKKKIKFITIPSTKKVYIETLNQVKAQGIWNNSRYRSHGKSPILYLDSFEILRLIEATQPQEKEKKIFAVDVDVQNDPNLQPQYYILDWDKTAHEDEEKNLISAFDYINSFLHYEGLLCLRNGEMFYLNPNNSEQNTENEERAKEKKSLPDLEKEEKLLIVEIDASEGRDYTYIEERIVRESVGKIYNYWELYCKAIPTSNSSGVNNFNFSRTDVFINSKGMILTFGNKDEDGEDVLSINQALKKYRINRKYREVFKEKNTLLVLNSHTFFLSEMEQRFYSFRRADQRFHYKELKIIEDHKKNKKNENLGKRK
ncbi:hypothetical protein [Candidatus Lokiarchaeum ossiferum]|uniref:hypothetical protein n=1 Tax=Candidatus Lokiarchaeum ossiferum TaxID=2951803 RepID=UPI00352E722D